MNLWIFLVSFFSFPSSFYVSPFRLFCLFPLGRFLFSHLRFKFIHTCKHTQDALFSLTSLMHTHKTFIFVLISFGSLDFDYLSC